MTDRGTRSDIQRPALGEARRALGSAGVPLAEPRPLGIVARPGPSIPVQAARGPGDLGRQIFDRLARESAEDTTIQPSARAEGPGGNPALVFVRTRRRPPTPAPPPVTGPIRGSAVPSFLRDARDEGRPLMDEHRAALEPVIGRSLNDVRIHSSDAAAAMAQRFGADAFTVGRDVFFARGKFEPWSPRGYALLAHELVHVRQQIGLGDRVQRFGDASDSAEAEAERVERAVLAGEESSGPGGLAVDHYRRHYRTRDGRALGPDEVARLDAISSQTLMICERALGPTLSQHADRVIDAVDVSVNLDLAIVSDEQAAELWGQAMASAVRRALS